MADLFYEDTGLAIANAEARMVLCFSLWLKGDKDKGLEEFDRLAIEIAFIQKPSPSTVRFLKDLLAAMPKEMQRDKRIQESLRFMQKYPDTTRTNH